MSLKKTIAINSSSIVVDMVRRSETEIGKI